MLAVGIAKDEIVFVSHSRDVVELLARGDGTAVGGFQFALEVLASAEMRCALVLGFAVAVTSLVVVGAESVHDVSTVVARGDAASAALPVTVRREVLQTVSPLIGSRGTVATGILDRSVRGGPDVRARVTNKVADLGILGRVSFSKHGIVLGEGTSERMARNDDVLQVRVGRLVKELVDEIVERFERRDGFAVGTGRVDTGGPASSGKH